MATDDPKPEGGPPDAAPATPAAPSTDAAGAETKGEKPSRIFLVIFQTGDNDDPLGDMSRFLYHVVTRRLDETIETDPEQTEIDVWIDSPGGSATIAYKLFLNLKSRCHRLRMVIPDYAKSAATLLALGADVIYMSPGAELGPLDAQIQHPDREGVMVSALEVAAGFDFIGGFAAQYAVSGGAQVLHWTGLPRVDVLREFLRFSARLLEPAVNKLDPHLVYRATNQLDLAEKYAEIILNNRSPDVVPEGTDFNASSFVHELVRHYPIHEFAISRSEAKAKGLPVKDESEYEYWPYVYAFFGEYRNKMFSREPASIVMALTEDDLESMGDDEDDTNGTETADTSLDQDTQHKGHQNATHSTLAKVRSLYPKAADGQRRQP